MFDVSPDIDAYFGEVVRRAIIARRLRATEAAEHYLAGLLSDYARGEPLDAALDQPLTFQLRDALQTHGAQRFERLRGIGDAVLYVLGFFGSSFTRRGAADRDYVMSVGASAYGHASAMLRLGGADVPVHDVLDELSRKYDGFVEVLCEVAGAALSRTRDDTTVLKLYDSWQRTGSRQLEDALAELGLRPVKLGKGWVH